MIFHENGNIAHISWRHGALKWRLKHFYLCVPFLRVGHQFQLQTPRHVPPTVGSENQDCGALYHEPSCWCEVHSPELSFFSATANHMTKPRGPQPYSPNWSKIPFILQRKIWIYPPLVRHAKRDGVLVCFSFGHGEGLELRTFVTILITIDGIIAMFFVVLWSSRRFWGLEPSSRLGHIGAWGRALGREFEIFWILSDQHSILYQREQPTR